MGEEFFLKWSNHKNILIGGFDSLLESEKYADCILSSEGKILRAHKIVLSTCSPYLEFLLNQQGIDKHPILVFNDVKYQELKAMLDYMYKGEVNVLQEQLNDFLKAAKSLQLKGLTDRASSTTEPVADDPLVCKIPPDNKRTSGPLSVVQNKKKRKRRTSSEDSVPTKVGTLQCEITPIVTKSKISDNGQILSRSRIGIPSLVRPSQTSNRVRPNSIGIRPSISRALQNSTEVSVLPVGLSSGSEVSVMPVASLAAPEVSVTPVVSVTPPEVSVTPVGTSSNSSSLTVLPPGTSFCRVVGAHAARPPATRSPSLAPPPPPGRPRTLSHPSSPRPSITIRPQSTVHPRTAPRPDASQTPPPPPSPQSISTTKVKLEPPLQNESTAPSQLKSKEDPSEINKSMDFEEEEEDHDHCPGENIGGGKAEDEEVEEEEEDDEELEEEEEEEDVEGEEEEEENEEFSTDINHDLSSWSQDDKSSGSLQEGNSNQNPQGGGRKDVLSMEEFFDPESKKFYCHSCEKSYFKPEVLLRHRRFECIGLPRNKCSFCSFKTDNKKTLLQHTKRHHFRLGSNRPSRLGARH